MGTDAACYRRIVYIKYTISKTGTSADSADFSRGRGSFLDNAVFILYGVAVRRYMEWMKTNRCSLCENCI